MSDAGNAATERVLLLLTTIGRKSGREVRTELRANMFDGRLFIVASKAGSDQNPDWYSNLTHNPRVTVELASVVFPARAEPLPREQRDVVFAQLCRTAPNYTDYQELTTRIIPVVELIQTSEANPAT